MSLDPACSLVLSDEKREDEDGKLGKTNEKQRILMVEESRKKRTKRAKKKKRGKYEKSKKEKKNGRDETDRRDRQTH